MRILVCGGRDFGNLKNLTKLKDPELYAKRLAENRFVHETLNKLVCEHSTLMNKNDNWLPSDITFIAGGATGADECAAEFALVNWCQLREFPADWKKHKKSAGPIRNKQMLVEGKPDLVVAFPGGAGTADMVKQAKAAGVEVTEVEYAKD